MPKDKNSSFLCKIVYYDEESVADYVQIDNGGKLEITQELLKDTIDNAAAKTGLDAKLGISGMLKAILGNEIAASANTELDTSYNSEKLVKNVIKNTLLTDFINIIKESSMVESDTADNIRAIKKFTGYAIEAPKESISYVAMISPYFGMLRGGDIAAGDYNIAIDKLDNTIKNAKGYYEFLGVKKGDNNTEQTENPKRYIFRFNIKSFKNNYKPIDLLRMNLSVYAIKVGKSSIDMLDFSNEFKNDIHVVDNPSYGVQNNAIHNDLNNDTSEELDIYDVLLAGVEFNA